MYCIRYNYMFQRLTMAIFRLYLKYLEVILNLLCAVYSGGLGMCRVWVSRGGCIRSWWGNQRERDQWGDLGVDGWVILGWISRR